MFIQKQKIYCSKPFKTENGFVIKQPEVAFEEYGLKEGPTVLITHGGLQDYHAAGKYSETDPIPGPWDDIIGEGKAIDTRQYRVISANFLGSMFGSSSPISIDPDTGRPYGSLFPEITMIDMVNFYKAFLDELGISKLAIMAGPSTGALQTLQMAALYPDFVEKGIAVAGSGRMTPGGIAFHHFIINLLKSDPEFNNGNYELGRCKHGLKLVHQIGRIYFGNERIIKKECFDTVPESPFAHQQRIQNCYKYITDSLDELIIGRDANSYIRILNAVNSHDLSRGCNSYEEGVLRITCPLLLINIENDSEFPPYWGYEVAEILNKRTPNQAMVKTFSSDWGHYGCIYEAARIANYIKDFLSRE